MVLKNMVKSGVFLTTFALLGTVVLALSNQLTLPLIAANERAATLTRLNALISPSEYDNDLLNDQRVIPAVALNSAEPVTVYLARKQNQPVAALFTVTPANGYSGKIRLVVAVLADQSVAGVRILSHKETPGLGDKIDIAKSDWITYFNGKSLENPSLQTWAVRKDGGEFDQFTGATITPRAVVGAVKNTLLWSQQHFSELFIATPEHPLQESK
ncbi:electron transport complex subunit RsxG [Candidatus Thiothrix anitrata]|jgi:electron transport complex protein RnfG|uniref:Ion-translocating oxidoreductase complex subunit G n=1 Tax=Candidatus Thiothrix anitrata TaxID=2823902 RepID=A0ABX7X489_9GAMM|nr:electron transport complex subunit RsxG [Candidatus Thiothrix anitrata]QTR50102.1 electron transport complex subunit RsxG [Candidatus Thiothrix anitrata]